MKSHYLLNLDLFDFFHQVLILSPSIIIDLPAPVSPVNALKPFNKINRYFFY